MDQIDLKNAQENTSDLYKVMIIIQKHRMVLFMCIHLLFDQKTINHLELVIFQELIPVQLIFI